MANVLSAEKRLACLAALVNGSGVRAASRTTGVHQDTIGRFGFAVGEGCQRLHDRIARDLSCALVDMDEQHSWCAKRQQNLPAGAADDVGEQWTWAAMCRTSKLMIAWTVGKRTQEHADRLVADVRSRLVVMPQITTDGWKLYEAPIAVSFGLAVPYVQTVKNYSEKPSRTAEAEKFSPKRGVDFIQKRAIYGAPDFDVATTYAVERSNGTNRCWNARLHRRTLAYSKDLDRHKASMALMYVYRNLCWIQRNMRVTAAMAAGITDHVWELGELMDVALAEPSGGKPVPKPLVIPKPDVASRELPNGRGFLRSVGGKAGPPPPLTAPVAPVVQVVVEEVVETVAEVNAPVEEEVAAPAVVGEKPAQLDLLSWVAPPPKPRRMEQLDLFGRNLDK